MAIGLQEFWTRIRGKTPKAAVAQRARGTWSRAFFDQDTVAIADWFKSYYFWVGAVAIVIAGIAAGLSGADGVPPHPGKIVASLATRPSTGNEPSAQVYTRAVANAGAAPPALASATTNASRRSYDFSWALCLRVIGLGLIFAGACGILGWVFGLIFGVPRTTKDAESGGPGRTNGVNTNLEMISDWLTKTLVGVGLTQLYALPKFLGDIAADTNAYGFQWGYYGQLLTLSILLYFLTGGFWLGYVGTRTFITDLFDQFASGSWRRGVVHASSPRELKLNFDNSIQGPIGGMVGIDAALLSVPLQSLRNQQEIEAWAAAQARAGRYEVARAMLENVLANDPDNQDVTKQLVKVYIALQYYSAASTLAKTLAEDSPPKMIAALYDFAPGGFTEALRIGDSLMRSDEAQNTSTMHVWMACAYAQKFAYLKNTDDAGPQHETALKEAREKAYREIAAAVTLNPLTRKQLLKYWKPDDSDSLDNDLQAFGEDDAKLMELLEPGKAQTKSTDVQDKALVDAELRAIVEDFARYAVPRPISHFEWEFDIPTGRLTGENPLARATVGSIVRGTRMRRVTVGRDEAWSLFSATGTMPKELRALHILVQGRLKQTLHQQGTTASGFDGSKVLTEEEAQERGAKPMA